MRILALVLLPVLAFAKDFPVADATAFKEAIKKAQPGDAVVLAEGEWKDAVLKFVATGTKDQPVTVKAAKPGKTVLTGASQISFGGEFIVVEGLFFRDPAQASGEVIELRKDSKTLASHCIVRDCAVISTQPVDLGKKTSRFISLYGTENVVERSHVEGKTTGGTTLVVWLTPGGEGRHVIRDNYFGPRPVLGDNGGETIRLGDSVTHDQNARCQVTGNLFHHCNGEGEIISVKSCENRLAGNTFIECEGALTLRHAHRCLVEDNVFLGNQKKLTGGIRIVGEDHRVLNNYIEGCAGDGYRAAITFMNGIPNTDNSGYQQVKRALLQGNVVVDAKVSLNIGMQHDKTCTADPIDCTVKDNVFISPSQPLIHLVTSTPGWTWQNNVMIGRNLGMDMPGVITTKPEIKKPTTLTRDKVGPMWERK